MFSPALFVPMVSRLGKAQGVGTGYSGVMWIGYSGRDFYMIFWDGYQVITWAIRLKMHVVNILYDLP